MILPHVIFFAVLILNTVFSVRFWRPLQPKSPVQLVIDGVLLANYAALLFAIGRPIEFAFFAALLFIAATMKYAVMLGVVPHTDVLRKKIIIDLLGAFLCAAVLFATLMGYALYAAWALAVIFTLANIYLLYFRPMYKL